METPKKPLLTLICYRANGEDYFRGHVERRSDSQFSLYHSFDEEDIVLYWAKKRFDNYKSERGTADWEIKLLVDGREVEVCYNDEAAEDGMDDFDPSDKRQELSDRLESAAATKCQEQVNEDKAKEAAKEAAEKVRQETTDRERKLAQLQALQKELFGKAP